MENHDQEHDKKFKKRLYAIPNDMKEAKSSMLQYIIQVPSTKGQANVAAIMPGEKHSR